MSDKSKFRKRQAQLEEASEVLKSFFKKSPLSQQFTRWEVWNNWEQIVGADMIRYSSPIKYEKGTLVVWVSHPAHMKNLKFIEREIKAKINKYVGRRWVHRIAYDLNASNKPNLDESQTLNNILSDNKED